MLHKILFQKLREGANMICSCIFGIFMLWLNPTGALGQTECVPIEECDDLRLLFVREHPDTGCTTLGSNCSTTDPLHHVTYRVFLYYEVDSSVPDSILNFMLNYNYLFANVRLRNLDNNGLSYIDKNASRACMRSGAGVSWDLDSTVVYELSVANEASILFINESASACGPTDARIQFSPNPPSGAPTCFITSNCAYAELFPIIVQSYPGETIWLECKKLEYSSSVSTIPCDPLPCAYTSGTGTPNTNGVAQYTIPQVNPPSGANSQLEVMFGDTIYQPEGWYDTQVLLKRNGGSGNLDVSYVEFSVEVRSDVAISAPTTVSGVAPVSMIQTSGTGNAVTYTLHYVVPYNPAQTLAPDGLDSVSVIRVGPPMPFNQRFNMVLELVNEADSRVRTDQGCSSIDLSADTVLIINSIGDTLCPNYVLPGGVFRVEGREDTVGVCPEPQLRFGFVTTDTVTYIPFDYFELILKVHQTGNLSIKDVVFPSNWTCTNDTDCTSPCWELAPGFDDVVIVKLCRETGGFTFKNDSAFINIIFEGYGCINGADIEVLRFLRDDAAGFICVPEIDLTNQGFPVCSPEIKGTITSGITDEPVVDVDVLFLPNHNLICNSDYCPNDTMQTNAFGVFAKCGCVRCDTIVIKPQSPPGSDYLNGVSTFDLVLINKHILGVELFDSPYKIIAADANNSKSVTTFDIAELRKLILGIYSELPSCSSWEFIPTAFDLSIPLNPLNPSPPESIMVTSTTNYDFHAIKIGDVNGSADSSALRFGKQGSTFIEFQISQIKNDGLLVVPIVYTGADEVEALQCGIRFDPGQWEFVGATMGDLEGIGAESFGLTQADQGIVKMLWYAGYSSPDPGLKPGTTMFYLTFKSQGGLKENEAYLALDDEALENLAWAPNGKEFRIFANQNNSIERSEVSTSVKVLTVEASPNPTSGEVRLLVHSTQPTSARIGMFSSFGQMLWMQSINLPVGETSLETNVLINQPAGVYLWKVWTPQGAKAEGHLVKQ